MNKNQSSTTKIVAVGIGAAVFFILGRFLSIPIGIPNTSLETTYPFLALMSVLFGPVVGGLIGFIGHAVKDLLTYGLWISWVISSGITGVGYGLAAKKLDVENGKFEKSDIIKFNIGQVLTNLVAWALVAPALDILIYSEPANKVFVQGIVAALTNSLSVAIIGTLLIIVYTKTRTPENSLKRD
ncbi:MAG: ECF-type riboflavin transporter substrate-binding protein [Anaerococcus sp.]|uniref:ECF-type riboflavin transporter substrate-binding protein n=1 Tax=Anaerococcus sp. TaxID=1872515 RepID=UPI00291273E7|nr:ECF-type riboflavin transporter substrate-binding protein [Anaerococcus sp.]MDU7412409.1 ECF-type riboflavin transporter substrate-binding protein [Anaerococcus sp.]